MVVELAILNCKVCIIQRFPCEFVVFVWSRRKFVFSSLLQNRDEVVWKSVYAFRC